MDLEKKMEARKVDEEGVSMCVERTNGNRTGRKLDGGRLCLSWSNCMKALIQEEHIT